MKLIEDEPCAACTWTAIIHAIKKHCIGHEFRLLVGKQLRKDLYSIGDVIDLPKTNPTLGSDTTVIIEIMSGFNDWEWAIMSMEDGTIVHNAGC